MDLSMLRYDTMSLWLLGALLFLGLILGREIGHALGQRRRRASEHQIEDGFTVASVLGLLGLLIAFTFSLTMQRYDNRRELVIAEANALGTTWLRTQLLDEGDRARLQGRCAGTWTCASNSVGRIRRRPSSPPTAGPRRCSRRSGPR